MPDFAFATCLPGLEPAVKRDVLRARPELRLAYSRPGLVTFKSDRAIGADDARGTPFARVWGRSLGPARDPDAAAHQLAFLGVQRVHVFARDPDAAVDVAPWERAIAMSTGPAAPGELVADVMIAADEPAWLGLHRASDDQPAHAGGAIPVDVPADAPSRAYAKLDEAIAWARLPIAAGDVALDIGSAPGGAALALARRGVDTWCVDAAELAPQVRALPNVHHLAITIGALRFEQLPARVDWLLVDMNVAPQIAVHEVLRFAPRLAPTLRGAVITLKLNDWDVVDELPALAQRIAQLGLPDVPRS